MIRRAVAVENNLLDPFGEGRLRGYRAERLCTRHIRAQFLAVWSGLAQRRGRSERDACGIINELNVNVLLREAHAHARTVFGSADFLADAPLAQFREFMFLFGSHREN